MVTMTPTSGFSVILQLKIQNSPGNFAKLASVIAQTGGSLGEIVLEEETPEYNIRKISVYCTSEEKEEDIIIAVSYLDFVELLEVEDRVFQSHLGGKIEIKNKIKIKNRDSLSMAYTPGVGRVCMDIYKNPADARKYTIKANCVAVVSDGTAVLGLGDIGPAAAMPVMEGKAMLFKEFGDIDAFPICLATKDPEEIIRTVELLEPTFGGINLEDISAPRCFEIEERLKEKLNIPVFHDDQHGTAVVVLASAINALKIVGKNFEDIKVVVNGVGAAGVACAKILMLMGVRNIIGLDTKGTIYKGRKEGMNMMKEWFAEHTNPECVKGNIIEASKGADMFLGLSAAGAFPLEALKQMGKDPIVFALANPIPEIMPEEAQGYARIIATGRSDYPNQINNVLCFPGIFRGALDSGARQITDEMKLAAAKAIASIVTDEELNEHYIIPNVFNRSVPKAVAKAVTKIVNKNK